MLNLSRKIGKSIIIKTPSGDEIAIHLLKASGNYVVVGIEAPREYEIFREELLHKESEIDE